MFAGNHRRQTHVGEANDVETQNDCKVCPYAVGEVQKTQKCIFDKYIELLLRLVLPNIVKMAYCVFDCASMCPKGQNIT